MGQVICLGLAVALVRRGGLRGPGVDPGEVFHQDPVQASVIRLL